MRPMPTLQSYSFTSSSHDQLASWLEDYVLDKVVAKFPNGDAWSISAERRSDYYAIKVFTPSRDHLPELERLVDDWENDLRGRGISVIFYPQISNIA